MKIRRPEMFNLAEKGGKPKLLKIILMFALLSLFTTIAASLPVVVIQIIETAKLISSGMSPEEATTILENFVNTRTFMYISLYATILESIVVILWCRFKEKRSLESLGFKRKNALRDYAIGMLIGFVMFSAVVGINILTGAMTIESATENITLGTLGFILIFFIGFVFQGAFEEILFRGYLMVNIGAKHKMSTAIIISSIAFAIFHGANPGITLLSLINLALIAIFFALYIICFDNIWGACAIHSVWNFVQGNFYGISVSGLNVFESVFVSTSIPGKEFINGGAFGAEGGIATSIVNVLAIVILLIYMKKKGQITKETVENN